MTDAPLKLRIQEDMKAAMRAKDQPRLNAIRLILAAIKQKEVDERIELSEADIFAILNKMVKQRRDSIEQYEKAQRQDLVDQETFELKIIEAYLPAPLTPEELTGIIARVLQEVDAHSMQDLGKVMAVLKPQLQGRADLRAVSDLVKAKLS